MQGFILDCIYNCIMCTIYTLCMCVCVCFHLPIHSLSPAHIAMPNWSPFTTHTHEHTHAHTRSSLTSCSFCTPFCGGDPHSPREGLTPAHGGLVRECVRLGIWGQGGTVFVCVCLCVVIIYERRPDEAQAASGHPSMSRFGCTVCA